MVFQWNSRGSYQKHSLPVAEAVLAITGGGIVKDIERENHILNVRLFWYFMIALFFNRKNSKGNPRITDYFPPTMIFQNLSGETNNFFVWPN